MGASLGSKCRTSGGSESLGSWSATESSFSRTSAADWVMSRPQSNTSLMLELPSLEEDSKRTTPATVPKTDSRRLVISASTSWGGAFS